MRGLRCLGSHEAGRGIRISVLQGDQHRDMTTTTDEGGVDEMDETDGSKEVVRTLLRDQFHLRDQS
jgi:hypothetical protein